MPVMVKCQCGSVFSVALAECPKCHRRVSRPVPAEPGPADAAPRPGDYPARDDAAVIRSQLARITFLLIVVVVVMLWPVIASLLQFVAVSSGAVR